MVDNSLHFLPVVNKIAPIKLLLPKPNTADPAISAKLRSKYPNHHLTREWALSAEAVLATFDEKSVSGDLIFIDIGGYFAHSIDEIAQKYTRGRILGCMEGTENGVAKYRKTLDTIGVPIYSVADSRLKYPENHLVGVSVVHSIESVVREIAEVLQGYRACVIGYGKVGRSVAEALRGRGVPTIVCDEDPIAQAEAAARGFTVMRSKKTALARSNLVIGATGNKSLGKQELSAIRPGTLIATVTSSDDEIDLESLATGWAIERGETGRGTPLTHYRGSSTSFYLLNDGKTINFLHGAVIGPAIQLIEGEKLAAIHALIENNGIRQDASIRSVTEENRKRVARIWVDHFVRDEI